MSTPEPLAIKGCVGIVDYGMGNLASVERGLAAVAPEVEVVRVERPEDARAVHALVLPGVGAFAAAMDNLRQRHLTGALRDYLAAGRPLLGICLGYQLLFEESEEALPHHSAAGLGYFPGKVRRFPAGVTVPHMGWNRLELTGAPSPLFGGGGRTEGVPTGRTAGPYVYFAHSYYPDVRDPCMVAAWCEVGQHAAGQVGGVKVRFAAAAWRGAAGGVQFHPEKSGAAGLQLLAWWLTASLAAASG